METKTKKHSLLYRIFFKDDEPDETVPDTHITQYESIIKVEAELASEHEHPVRESAEEPELAAKPEPLPEPSKFKKFCPQCGRNNEKQKRFCAECGCNLE